MARSLPIGWVLLASGFLLLGCSSGGSTGKLPGGGGDGADPGLTDPTDPVPPNPTCPPGKHCTPDGQVDSDQDGIADTQDQTPYVADADQDDLSDVLEDRDGDGLVGPDETDPRNPDTDGDGIRDGLEDWNRNGQKDPLEMDPRKTDTDADGLPDGIEDTNGNGRFDAGETNPNQPDSDGDGLSDGTEDANHNGLQDAGETSPLKKDSDGDGLTDGQEQVSHTDPVNPDSDGDGVPDGDEDRNGDGILGTCTQACASDADCNSANGETCLSTSLKVCWSVACAQGETNPMSTDSDEDGLADNQEGTSLVCNASNLKEIDLYRNWEADYHLALEKFFTVHSELFSGVQKVGGAYYAPTERIASFVVTRDPGAGTTSANLQESLDRATIGALGAVSDPQVRTLKTFAGYDAVVGKYQLTVSARTPSALANQLAQALLGGAALTGTLAEAGESSTIFSLYFETIYRSNQQVLTIAALTAGGLSNDDQIIRLLDVTNSTALAQASDRVGARCDSFASDGKKPVDFIWVVDNSGSMEQEQAAVAAAAQAMADLLNNSTLDWRIGVTNTANATDGVLTGGDFTTDINTFKTRVTSQGTSGSGSEYGLKMGKRAVERASPCGTSTSELRCDATLIVVILTDEEDQTIEAASGGENYAGAPDPATVSTFIADYKGKSATLFTIAGGNPKCSTAYNASKGYDAVVAGLPGSAGFSICSADQTNNMNEIVRAANGVSSSYNLSGMPISATIKVAMQTAAGQAPVLIPRSRTNGFDYDGTKNSLLFYGTFRPTQQGLDIAVSYRAFERCVPVAEICDGIDNDCDGNIDNIDQDLDGWTLCQGDCDDTNPALNPDAAEVCDGIDNNCNGLVDEGFDLDNDGWTTCRGDCDDLDSQVNPAATEICNLKDDNCDNKIDDLNCTVD